MQTVHFEINDTDKVLLDQLTGGGSVFVNSELNAQTVGHASNAEIVTVFINSKVDQEIIDQLPNLKLIVTRSTGFDHIDVAYAQSKGITVCNVPAYGSRTVAEFAFALILGLSRKTFYAVKQIKEHNDWSVDQFEGFNLQGKTLGIVGTGKIGLNVARIAKGFEMNVIANDAFPNHEAAAQHGFTYTTLDNLLSQSDIVTLHVPALPETHHLINSHNIHKFKPGALLINTSRGDVVESEAILAGLDSGILGGVGLDVLEGEHELKEEAEFMGEAHPNTEKMKILIEDHRLMQHPKAIITPHIAFNTHEARLEILHTTIKNIEDFAGGQPQNVITAQ